MGTMGTIEEIIDRLIEKSRLDLTNTSTPKTLGELAKAIEITPTHFSRIRKGKAKLQPELAKKIASAFYKGDELNAERLVADLIKAEEFRLQQEQTREIEEQAGLQLGLQAADELFISVSGLFDRLSNSESLLIIDYRDIPQATKGGHYHDLLSSVVLAISEGLNFALIQPFATKGRLQKTLIACIEKSDQSEDYAEMQVAVNFLHTLAMGVRNFYREVRRELSEKARSGEKVKGQICLYEAKREVPLLVACGIQSRLFYAVYPYNQKQRQEVYQWVVENNNLHRFRHRDLTSISIEAVRLQFSPIPQFWEKNRRLPETEKDLKEAWKGLIAELRNVDGDNKSHFEWVVVNDEETESRGTDGIAKSARRV